MTLEEVPILPVFSSGLKRLKLHWRLFQTQRRISEQAVLDQDQDPVIFFNASTRLRGLSQNAAFSLIAAWGVQMAGVPVLHFACHSGMTHCVLGTVHGELTDPPPCEGCMADTTRFTQPAPTIWFEYEEDDRLRSDLEGLTVSDMSTFEFQGRPLGTVVLPSLRWALRRHDLQDNHATRHLLRSYILSAHSIAQAFTRAIEKHTPQAVVVFNGLQYPEAVVRNVAREHDVRVITHEVGFRPLSAFFTTGEATRYPMEISEDFQLSQQENELLDNYLKKRFQGEFTMAGIEFWPEMQDLDPSIQDKIDHFEGVVPVFTNVVFDTSQAFANTLFSDMFDWLDTVAQIISSHPHILFVIRAHPDEMREGKASQQSVADWVADNHLDSLDNVIFIGPEEPFSSYELIDQSKIVIVYNSSIGLEASLLGVPVLCGGRARYTQYPIVIFPDSREDFVHRMEELLRAEEIDIPDVFPENARKFLYYQLYKTSLPFDGFLKEHPGSGYVTLKDFPISMLEKENSQVIRTLVEGIVGGGEFILSSRVEW